MKRVIQLGLGLAAIAFLATAPAQAAEVEGTVKNIEGRIIELENGTMLILEPTTSVDREALVPGAEVKASYEVRGGENMVTVIEVRAPGATRPSSPSGTSSSPSTMPSDKPSTMPSDKPAGQGSQPSTR